jgi:hypothetical protein
MSYILKALNKALEQLNLLVICQEDYGMCKDKFKQEIDYAVHSCNMIILVCSKDEKLCHEEIEGKCKALINCDDFGIEC